MRILLLLVYFFVLPLGLAFGQLPESPSGLVVREILPENSRVWYFCPNGNVQMIEDKYPEKSVYVGAWKFKEGLLTINLFVNYGKRGIGEPWEKDNFRGFNEYVDFVNEVKEEFKFNWKQMNSSDSGELIPFEIVKTGYSCPASVYYPQLPGQYPVASYRLLTEKDLEKLSLEELEIMRNEIYARYGYKFEIKNTFDYFIQQEWYFPDKKTVDAYLTNIEKRNIRTISAYERRLKK